MTTRVATRAFFVRHLKVTDEVADELLIRFELCEVVRAEQLRAGGH